MFNMTNKLIRDIDDDLWRKFVGYCKIKGTTVSAELSTVLEDHLKHKLKEAFK